MDNPSDQTVVGIAALCGTGVRSSRDILERYLDAIAAGNEALHAFIEVFDAPARQRADELDRAAALGGPVGPLHGVPIAVKDLARLEGRLPGFGSKCYRGMEAGPTAPAVQRLVDAGAIILGMTHMVEFASGGWGTNYAMGTPWNPIDRQVHRVPGGSSSGSAVAVAAGLAPAAIGSDTGGSIRIPASLCGLVGFRPGFGLIPLEGIAPLSPTFDTLGPLTRTVADARLLFSVLGRIPMPPSTKPRPLRIGVPAPEQLQPCDPEILEAFLRSLDHLRARGHRVETLTLPMELSAYQAINGQIAAYEGYRHHQPVLEDSHSPLDPFVRQRLMAGGTIDEAAYEAVKVALRNAIGDFRKQAGHFDMFAMPSTPLPAIPVSEVDDHAIPMSRYTRFGNCLDLCGISLPNGSTAAGLPTGLQLMSWAGQEAQLLDLAEDVYPA
ncbi:MAG: amidase [Beijerinckiaceae bacterium]|nr:amidase [Beijerinckiaceae bacterium]MCZ8300275.1 amidase [Beijerinckiaceae bacterium]